MSSMASEKLSRHLRYAGIESRLLFRMKATGSTSLGRLCVSAFVCFMMVAVVALAVEAKHSQFSSPDSSTSYLSKAIKMKECRAESGHTPPCVAAELEPQTTIEPESRILVASTTRPRGRSPLVHRQFRAPPATA